jgi:hypothetical protein
MIVITGSLVRLTQRPVLDLGLLAAVSGPVSLFLGRRGTIFVSAIFCVWTPIDRAVIQTWQEPFATRILMSIGMGLEGATVPMSAAENAPAVIRGALV